MLNGSVSAQQFENKRFKKDARIFGEGEGHVIAPCDLIFCIRLVEADGGSYFFADLIAPTILQCSQSGHSWQEAVYQCASLFVTRRHLTACFSR